MARVKMRRLYFEEGDTVWDRKERKKWTFPIVEDIAAEGKRLYRIDWCWRLHDRSYGIPLETGVVGAVIFDKTNDFRVFIVEDGTIHRYDLLFKEGDDAYTYQAKTDRHKQILDAVSNWISAEWFQE